MRAFGRLVLILGLVLTVAVPASAGTEERPDLSDECSGYLHSVEGSTRARHPSLDLCKGWFTTTTAPSGAPALEVALKVNSAPVDGLTAAYMTFWRTGGCSYGVVVDGALNAPHPQAFSVDCEPPGETTCTVPAVSATCTTEDTTQYFALPDGSVVWNDDELRVTVPFEGALAGFAGDHDAGSVLATPLAVSVQVVGPVYAWTAGCSVGLVGQRCFEANGDWMRAAGDSSVRL